MFLFRIVLIVLLVLALFFWLRMRATANRRPKHAQSVALSMRACAHCGVHVPENEALVDQEGAFFCCARHLAESKERR